MDRLSTREILDARLADCRKLSQREVRSILRTQDVFAGSGQYSILTGQEPPEPAKCS